MASDLFCFGMGLLAGGFVTYLLTSRKPPVQVSVNVNSNNDKRMVVADTPQAQGAEFVTDDQEEAEEDDDEDDWEDDDDPADWWRRGKQPYGEAS